ncbi:MAG: helix-turn-helix domain-containing protein [Pseudomonadota bacterium]
MEGNVARNLYEVMEGAVMLYKLLPDGRRQVVELISPGDVFGFGLEDIHDCSAETLMPTRLCIISQDAVDRCPEIQKRLLQHTREQLLHMHHHAVLLGRKSAMERVASFIERLARTGGAAESLRLAMTRQEIADYLGLTIETVSRSFSELRRRGLVICERQDRIRVPDLKGISQLTGA